MLQRRIMSTHALSRTVKSLICICLCAVFLSACTIRSGEQVVMLQAEPNQTTAFAVQFVGSEGILWRTIKGLQPDSMYQVEVQAQVRSGAMRLLFRDQVDDGVAIIVVPRQVSVAELLVQSTPNGEAILEEMTYQARGGEYQLRFVPLVVPSRP